MALRSFVPIAIAFACVSAGCTQTQDANRRNATTSVMDSTSSSPVSSTPPQSPEVTTPTASLAPTPTPTDQVVPPVSAAAQAVGLVDVRTAVPDAIIDLRYATANNFVGVQLYPSDARCLVHQSVAPGLAQAAATLRAKGYSIVFWDCYRPHSVQQKMWEVMPNANWVARPGPYARSHEAGRSVDITLAQADATRPCPSGQSVQQHCLLDMGTGFDDFTARATAYATAGVSSEAQANRTTLRDGLATGGLKVYSGEWWHFDGPDASVPRPHLNAPVD